MRLCMGCGGPRRHTCAPAAWAALVIVALAGCNLGDLRVGGHGRFDVSVENRRDQRLLVSFAGYEWPMEGCSLHYDWALVGPLAGEPVEVRVADEDGNLVYTASVVADDKTGGLPKLAIVIPPQHTDSCPPDDRTGYRLTIHNRLRDEVDFWIGEERLGAVGSLEERTFGLVGGNWETRRAYAVRDAAGREMRLGEEYFLSPLPVIYRLGEVPHVTLYVTRGWEQ